MSIWLEQKYINLLSHNLELFKVKDSSKYLVTFRCPYCGDSKKDPTKTRGNCFENNGSIFYHCYNCSVSTHSSKLIEFVDPQLYKEYQLEKIKNSNDIDFQSLPSKTPKKKKKYPALENIENIDSLPDSHIAKKYVISRKIPKHTFKRLYYTPTFYKWINTLKRDKFSSKALKFDHPRLILPMINENGKFIGVQGRSFEENADLRYITIMFNENSEKVFGLDYLDFSKRTYIVEGPIDSLFLENGIAMAGINSKIEFLSNPFTIILDNEPRNRVLINRMNKYIEMNYEICIWPSSIQDKDINNMILYGGYSPSQIQKIIKTNTFSGLSAKLKLNAWRKV